MSVNGSSVQQLVPASTIPVSHFEVMNHLETLEQAGNSSEGLQFRDRSACPIIWSELRQSLVASVPLVIGDTLALVASFGCAAMLVHAFVDTPGTIAGLRQLAVLAVIGTVVKGFMGCYPGIGTNPVVELRQLTLAGVFTFLLLLALHAVVGTLFPLEALATTLACLIAFLAMPIFRNLSRTFASRLSWWGVPVIIVGAGRHGLGVYDFFKRAPKLGLRPVGIVDRPDMAWESIASDDYSYLGSLEDLDGLVTQKNIFWAVAAVGDKPAAEQIDILRRCQQIPNMIVLPDLPYVPSLWSRSQECGGVIGFLVRENLLLPIPRIVKRIVDFAVSASVVVLALPLALVIMGLIKLVSPGPVFYGHERIGRYGKRFPAWKFRTMKVDADQALQQHLEQDADARAEWERDHKLRQDPRIIPGIGGFLRKTSLDELPQIWNVLQGEMSLVGPRPIVEAEIEKYRGIFPLYVKVRPGITGLWQISGRNNTTYDDRVALDCYYVRNWSPWLDLYILSRTIKTVLFREGAF